MKKMILAAALVAALCSLVSAQDTKALPPAAISQKVIAPAIPGRPPISASISIWMPTLSIISEERNETGFLSHGCRSQRSGVSRGEKKVK